MLRKIDTWIKNNPQAVKFAAAALSALLGWLTHRYGPDVTPQACRASQTLQQAGTK